MEPPNAFQRPQPRLNEDEALKDYVRRSLEEPEPEPAPMDNQRLSDMVRVATMSEYDRAVDIARSIEDAIQLEHMRHTNELDRLQHQLELANQAVSHAAMHQGR